MSDTSAWEDVAPRWERGRELLWGSTREVSEWLVDRLDPQPGQTILELAAGTGETGFLAASRLGESGRLISSDFSPSMVDAARRVADDFAVTNVDFRVLDACAIDLRDASVDGLLSRYGYVLKGEPPVSLVEARRVLRPGGRFAFAVWSAREHNAWMTVPSDVMIERGRLAPPSPAEVRLSERRNPDSIRALLVESGFRDVTIEEQAVAYRFANADELWFFVSELRGPGALAMEKLDDAERDEVRAEIERRADRDGDGFALGGVSVNVVAS